MLFDSIRLYGDPTLHTRSKSVIVINDKLKSLTEQMFETMYVAGGIGLAAPQVGVSKRLYVYDLGEGAKVMINPEIHKSEEEETAEEGCLSLPNSTFQITRSRRVHVTGVNLNGEQVSIHAEGLEARLHQHEIDHLDGKLILDHKY